MHVLITNDDGPPSEEFSPYVLSLYRALKKYTNWEISVAVPHTQRSWIGKAHMIGQDVTASYVYVPPEGTVERSKENESLAGPYDVSQIQSGNSEFTQDNEWILLDATPASCANIGIHYLFPNKPPVDLVISGPNFGRNSTALYIMSSGTVGAAMEAALCGIKSIGISYAYETRQHDYTAIDKASKISVKLIEYLYNNWGETESHNRSGIDAVGTAIAKKSKEEQDRARREVQLYSINVPLAETLSEDTRIVYAHILQNQWGPVFEPWEQYEERVKQKAAAIKNINGNGASATEAASAAAKAVSDEEGHIGVPVPKVTGFADFESEDAVSDSAASTTNGDGIAAAAVAASDPTNGTAQRDQKLTQFRWKPDYTAVRKSVQKAPGGNDGWAVDQGFISVTPLRACFHCVDIKGDIKL